MDHSRRQIRDAVTARADDLIPDFEGRVLTGRVGAIVPSIECPALYVDVVKSKATPFSQESSAVIRHFLVEMTLVVRGPDKDIAGDEIAVADHVDDLALKLERAFGREAVLGGALGFRVVDWRFLEDSLVLKDAGLPLAHLTLRFTCDVVHEDGEPVPVD